MREVPFVGIEDTGISPTLLGGSGALELAGPLHRADTVWPSLPLLLLDPLPLAGSEGIGPTAPTPVEAETEGAGPQSSQDQEGPVGWVWRQEVCGS